MNDRKKNLTNAQITAKIKYYQEYLEENIINDTMDYMNRSIQAMGTSLSSPQRIFERCRSNIHRLHGVGGSTTPGVRGYELHEDYTSSSSSSNSTHSSLRSASIQLATSAAESSTSSPTLSPAVVEPSTVNDDEFTGSDRVQLFKYLDKYNRWMNRRQRCRETEYQDLLPDDSTDRCSTLSASVDYTDSEIDHRFADVSTDASISDWTDNDNRGSEMFSTRSNSFNPPIRSPRSPTPRCRNMPSAGSPPAPKRNHRIYVNPSFERKTTPISDADDGGSSSNNTLTAGEGDHVGDSRSRSPTDVCRAIQFGGERRGNLAPRRRAANSRTPRYPFQQSSLQAVASPTGNERGSRAPVYTRSTPVDTRLALGDTHLAPVDTRLTPIDTHLAPVDARFDNVDTRFDTVGTRLTPIDTHLTPVADFHSADSSIATTLTSSRGILPPRTRIPDYNSAFARGGYDTPSKSIGTVSKTLVRRGEKNVGRSSNRFSPYKSPPAASKYTTTRSQFKATPPTWAIPSTSGSSNVNADFRIQSADVQQTKDDASKNKPNLPCTSQAKTKSNIASNTKSISTSNQHGRPNPPKHKPNLIWTSIAMNSNTDANPKSVPSSNYQNTISETRTIDPLHKSNFTWTSQTKNSKLTTNHSYGTTTQIKPTRNTIEALTMPVKHKPILNFTSQATKNYLATNPRSIRQSTDNTETRAKPISPKHKPNLIWTSVAKNLATNDSSAVMSLRAHRVPRYFNQNIAAGDNPIPHDGNRRANKTADVNNTEKIVHQSPRKSCRKAFDIQLNDDQTKGFLFMRRTNLQIQDHNKILLIPPASNNILDQKYNVHTKSHTSIESDDSIATHPSEKSSSQSSSSDSSFQDSHLHGSTSSLSDLTEISVSSPLGFKSAKTLEDVLAKALNDTSLLTKEEPIADQVRLTKCSNNTIDNNGNSTATRTDKRSDIDDIDGIINGINKNCLITRNQRKLHSCPPFTLRNPVRPLLSTLATNSNNNCEGDIPATMPNTSPRLVDHCRISSSEYRNPSVYDTSPTSEQEFKFDSDGHDGDDECPSTSDYDVVYFTDPQVTPPVNPGIVYPITLPIMHYPVLSVKRTSVNSDPNDEIDNDADDELESKQPRLQQKEVLAGADSNSESNSDSDSNSNSDSDSDSNSYSDSDSNSDSDSVSESIASSPNVQGNCDRDFQQRITMATDQELPSEKIEIQYGTVEDIANEQFEEKLKQLEKLDELERQALEDRLEHPVLGRDSLLENISTSDGEKHDVAVVRTGITSSEDGQADEIKQLPLGGEENYKVNDIAELTEEQQCTPIKRSSMSDIKSDGTSGKSMFTETPSDQHDSTMQKSNVYIAEQEQCEEVIQMNVATPTSNVPPATTPAAGEEVMNVDGSSEEDKDEDTDSLEDGELVDDSSSSTSSSSTEAAIQPSVEMLSTVGDRLRAILIEKKLLREQKLLQEQQLQEDRSNKGSRTPSKKSAISNISSAKPSTNTYDNSAYPRSHSSPVGPSMKRRWSPVLAPSLSPVKKCRSDCSPAGCRYRSSGDYSDDGIGGEPTADQIVHNAKVSAAAISKTLYSTYKDNYAAIVDKFKIRKCPSWTPKRPSGRRCDVPQTTREGGATYTSTVGTSTPAIRKSSNAKYISDYKLCNNTAMQSYSRSSYSRRLPSKYLISKPQVKSKVNSSKASLKLDNRLIKRTSTSKDVARTPPPSRSNSSRATVAPNSRRNKTDHIGHRNYDVSKPPGSACFKATTSTATGACNSPSPTPSRATNPLRESKSSSAAAIRPRSLRNTRYSKVNAGLNKTTSSQHPAVRDLAFSSASAPLRSKPVGPSSAPGSPSPRVKRFSTNPAVHRSACTPPPPRPSYPRRSLRDYSSVDATTAASASAYKLDHRPSSASQTIAAPRPIDSASFNHRRQLIGGLLPKQAVDTGRFLKTRFTFVNGELKRNLVFASSVPLRKSKSRFKLYNKNLSNSNNNNSNILATSLYNNRSAKLNDSNSFSSRYKLRRKYSAIHKKKIAISMKVCQYFCRFGQCKRGDDCRYIHDKSKVQICNRFARGTCDDKKCLFSHIMDRGKMAQCAFFLSKGGCKFGEECPYRHVQIPEDSQVCADFANGFCPNSSTCQLKHTIICDDYNSITGACRRVLTVDSKSRTSRPPLKCTLQHPIDEKARKAWIEKRKNKIESQKISRRAQMSASVAEKARLHACTRINLAMSDDEDFVGDGSLTLSADATSSAAEEDDVDAVEAGAAQEHDGESVTASCTAAFISSKNYYARSRASGKQATDVEEKEKRVVDIDRE